MILLSPPSASCSHLHTCHKLSVGYCLLLSFCILHIHCISYQLPYTSFHIQASIYIAYYTSFQYLQIGAYNIFFLCDVLLPTLRCFLWERERNTAIHSIFLRWLNIFTDLGPSLTHCCHIVDSLISWYWYQKLFEILCQKIRRNRTS